MEPLTVLSKNNTDKAVCSLVIILLFHPIKQSSHQHITSVFAFIIEYIDMGYSYFHNVF